ncbi:MAG: hypothetical protein PHS92_01970 [Candidatus Gracilibacteria bacterium]|nr:hypothetical protein [Candidatus Gracilibacteria bacterium]
MLIGIISSKLTSSKIIGFYGMEKVEKNDGYELYKNKNKILVVVNEDESNIEKSLIYLYSEYDPKLIFSFGLSESISNDHMNGDIVLPNVFVELNDEIENTLFTKENLDSFLKDPIFLESYTLQNDYDFDKFGLSVGGICVSGSKETGIDLREKIKFAYEADIYDRNSYLILTEAKNMNIIERLYVISAIYNKDDSIHLDQIIENGLYILNFLLDNVSKEEEEVIEVEI